MKAVRVPKPEGFEASRASVVLTPWPTELAGAWPVDYRPS
jgi:hypothetical protein